MADQRDVIDQADALMRRHRSFVAQPAEAAEAAVPPAPTFDADDADVPLLTEVVAPEHAAPDAALAALRQEIEAALTTWLVEALPGAVTSASQHILAELDAQARLTLLPRLLDRLVAPHEGGHTPAE